MLFKKRQDASFLLVKDRSYDESGAEGEGDDDQYLEYDQERKVYTNVQLETDFLTIIKEIKSKDIQEFDEVYVYLRLPAYEIEDITRGLKQ